MADLIFFVILGMVALWVAFVFLTKRGRGIMFGGKIVNSWDGVLGKQKFVTNRIKVHAVDVAPTVRVVGLEISSSTFGSYKMIPISLPASEALELARLLEEAAKYSVTDKT